MGSVAKPRFEAMKVFVSSVVDGYENYRAAAKDAIEALEHTPCLMEITHPASAHPPQAECFREIETSDVVVMLLGRRYGNPQESGKSPTHEEFDHARGLQKPILVFVEQIDDRESRQESFLSEISGWEQGNLWCLFNSPGELALEVVKALDRHRKTLDVESEPFERLPPVCQERIEQLCQSAPSAARQLAVLLSDPASRRPEGLSQVLRQPPDWLEGGGYVAWEAVAEFIDAYHIGNSGPAWEKAIEAGSPRSALYLTRRALAAAEDGDPSRAREILAGVESDDQLVEIAQACIQDDHAEVVKRAVATNLVESEDPDRALFGVLTLLSAYWHLERFDSATAMLRDANTRFPGRAWLQFHQAHATLGLVDQLGLNTPGSHDLLKEAAELALRSRDCFRAWDGPSWLAVDAAMRALLFIDDHHRVVELGSTSPKGEATAAEAIDPDVQAKLADAYLMLGRYSEIDALRLDWMDPSERAMIRAAQARGLGDGAGLPLMRKALELADDESSRGRALLGLASFGEVDEAAMEGVSAVDVALFRGVAALNRDELTEAVALLHPLRLQSYHHAYFLALAQSRTGSVDEAVETLTDAAEQLGIDALIQYAVEMLVEHDRLDEAASMASDALTWVQSRPVERSLRTVLTHEAQTREDWRTMELHARELVRGSPENDQAAWAVVYALHRRLKNLEAWAFLVKHDLFPNDKDTAQLAIAVCADVGATKADAGRLLQIAEIYSDHEIVAASALAAVMSGGDQLNLNDQQRSQLQDLLDGYLARYPDSQVLRTVSVESVEDLVERFAVDQQAQLELTAPLVEKVRYGLFPYGALRMIRELPYAELLLNLVADELTAIPTETDRRNREREAAARALGTRVAVDTSVAVLGIHADLDIDKFTERFERVFVADELVFDARAAVASARRPPYAVLTYEPGLGSPHAWEISEEQRSAARQGATRVLRILEGWQASQSGHLSSPQDIEDSESVSFRPWDASVRLAVHCQHPLWCDDLGLRSLAESQGVATFGTWALCEALSETPDGSWLPQLEDLKMRLLRARIADVPITIVELEQKVDDSDEPDFAYDYFLSRPFAWSNEPSACLRSYLMRVSDLARGPHKSGLVRLLHAACLGLGATIDPSERQEAFGRLLGHTLLGISDPKFVPRFLAVVRMSAGKLDPAGWQDPLDKAVLYVLQTLEGVVDANDAALFLTWLFSQTASDDRRVVVSTILATDRE